MRAKPSEMLVGSLDSTFRGYCISREPRRERNDWRVQNADKTHARRNALGEDQAVADEIVRCRELVVEAPGCLVSLPRVPVETRQATCLCHREQVFDERAADAMASCLRRDEQIFEIADRGERPCTCMENRDGETRDLPLPFSETPEQLRARREHPCPGCCRHRFRDLGLVECAITCPQTTPRALVVRYRIANDDRARIF